MIGLYTILGAIGRVIYGTHGLKYWSFLLLLPVGYFAAYHESVYAACVVSFAAVMTFNPGAGSYMDAGQSPNPDNEFLAPVLRLTPLKDGTVLYDCVGLGLRYGLSTAFIAFAMFVCNLAFETHYDLWIAPVGLSVGLFGWLKNWQAKEFIIGAVTYGAVAWA